MNESEKHGDGCEEQTAVRKKKVQSSDDGFGASMCHGVNGHRVLNVVGKLMLVNVRCDRWCGFTSSKFVCFSVCQSIGAGTFGLDYFGALGNPFENSFIMFAPCQFFFFLHQSFRTVFSW